MKRNMYGPESALKVAIQYETNKYKLYTRTINKVKDEECISILRYLSRQERERIRQLKDMYQTVSGRRLMAINLNGDENIRPKLIFNLYKEPLKILDFAIQNDKEALAFFKESGEFCINPEGRKMFEYLAGQKENHLEILRMEYRVREKDYAASHKVKSARSARTVKNFIEDFDPVAQFI